MRRHFILSIAAAVIAIGACSAGPADPTELPQRPDLILYGTPDGNAHPYVGFLIFFTGTPPVPAWLCTGAALDENTVLTAGHCTSGATSARFYQSEKPFVGGPILQRGIVGTPITYPGYQSNPFPNTGDIGVVQLTTGVAAAPFAQLPRLNALNSVSKHQLFDIVGYGVEDVRPIEIFNGERKKAQVKLVNATSGYSGGFNLHLSSNNGKPHRGGLCFGDSGGPVLLGSKVYAVNSFVLNSNCAGSGFSYRVDIDPVRTWIIGQKNN
jgi:hypothetical protein